VCRFRADPYSYSQCLLMLYMGHALVQTAVFSFPTSFYQHIILIQYYYSCFHMHAIDCFTETSAPGCSRSSACQDHVNLPREYRGGCLKKDLSFAGFDHIPEAAAERQRRYPPPFCPFKHQGICATPPTYQTILSSLSEKSDQVPMVFIRKRFYHISQRHSHSPIT
jgi:hypothetical protein